MIKTGSYYQYKNRTYCYICSGFSPGDKDLDYCMFTSHPYLRIGVFTGGLIHLVEPSKERYDRDVVATLFESHEFEDHWTKMSGIEFAE